MKFRWEKKYLYWGFTAFLVIVGSILFFLLLYNIPAIGAAVGVAIGILMPFILGFIFAYLLNPLMTFLEKKWFTPLFNRKERIKPTKAPRILAVAVSEIFALSLIVGLVILLVIQLPNSISSVINNIQASFPQFVEWIKDHLSAFPDVQEFVDTQFGSFDVTLMEWLRNLIPNMGDILSSITNGVISVVMVIMNFSIGIIVSIYLLMSKEKFCAQTKKLFYAIFPVKAVNFLLKITRRSDRMFGRFLMGKIIDSAVIGCLCYIIMLIFNWPFALLISVIVGVTNIIPFFGPFIGAIPSLLLILMVNPLSALGFLIAIILLQQFDGNILGPRILGNSIGLSAFWVMFGILVGGGLFGFVGMLAGVPIFAVIYSLIVEFSDARLKKMELPHKTKEYYDIDYIDNYEEPIFKEGVDDVKIANLGKDKKADQK